MLAKKYRLPSSFFRKIEKEKIRPRSAQNSASFSVKIYFSPLNYSRFAAVASVNIFKNSVSRNKARRIFYETIRKSNIYLRQNLDCVFYLKKPILEMTQSEVESEITRILNNM